MSDVIEESYGELLEFSNGQADVITRLNKEIEKRDAEAISLKDINYKFESSLKSIVKHLELIGGTAVAFSSVYMIATKYLNLKDKL